MVTHRPVGTQASLVPVLFELLAAFNADDLSAVEDRVDPDVVYLIPGRATVSGEFQGPEQTIGAFRRLREGSGGSMVVEPRTVLADSDHVMFTARVTAHRHDRNLDVTNAYLYRFRDGKLIEGRLFPGDLHAIEAFFGRVDATLAVQHVSVCEPQNLGAIPPPGS